MAMWQFAVQTNREQTMSIRAIHETRLNFRLPAHLKALIEEAAAQLGQTVSNYAIAALVSNARMVLQQQSVTALTKKDRDVFLAMLDDAKTQPTKALKKAAARYKKNFA
jgi:uncharacterized protein (DUF1778 family)